jgi:hypothetical protein
LVTSLPLLTVAYASAVYILALHEVEGVSRWDALRYVVTLILGINLPFMVVENGQALVTKEAGKIGVIGGPGELIIKQGNAEESPLSRRGFFTRCARSACPLARVAEPPVPRRQVQAGRPGRTVQGMTCGK